MCGRDRNRSGVGVGAAGLGLRGLSGAMSLSGRVSSIFALVLFRGWSAPRNRASDGSASGGADSVRE